MKRFVKTGLLAVVACGLLVIVTQTFSNPGSGMPAAPVTDPAAQLAQGAYLARAGNCMACHTTRGGEAYAGGGALKTGFGTFYAPNITPDPATGIGTWSADDFWRAMHNGKSKDGSFLYPAFPYPNYTKVSRRDSDALFAYLRSLTPVERQRREHDLSFPYNQRIVLAFWRTLYFSPGTFEPQERRTAEWNRGAYLVQGLGHCSACHADRSGTGGSFGGELLGGGMMPDAGWYAPALSSAPHALGEWSVDEVARLLKDGVSERGTASGPMAGVVSTSLQHLSRADVRAMAVYVKSVPAGAAPDNVASAGHAGDRKLVLREGARLYENQCASCHGSTGTGAWPAYPPLAGNRAVDGVPLNPIRMVLNGGYAPGTGGNPRPYGMPPFSGTMSDRELAAVLSFIRTSWGNRGGMVSAVDVSRARGAPAVE